MNEQGMESPTFSDSVSMSLSLTADRVCGARPEVGVVGNERLVVLV